MTKPHEEIANSDTTIAIVIASLIVGLLFYLAGDYIHFLVYAGLWLFLGWLSLIGLLAGKRTAAAQEAQIEMNERQKADTPGVSEQHPPVAAEKQEAPAGAQKVKRRGDAPSAPPPSNNWPR